MQIPHRGVVGVFTGVALGIGSTLVMQRALEQHLGEQSKSQARAIPALTSLLFLQGEPALGETSALLTIVEFSDFECSYCRHFHEQVFPQLKSQYSDTGLVRFVHKDLPLPLPPPCPAGSRSSTLCG